MPKRKFLPVILAFPILLGAGPTWPLPHELRWEGGEKWIQKAGSIPKSGEGGSLPHPSRCPSPSRRGRGGSHKDQQINSYGSAGGASKTQPNKLKPGEKGGRGGQRPLALERCSSGTLLSSTMGERGLFFILGTRCSSCWASW